MRDMDSYMPNVDSERLLGNTAASHQLSVALLEFLPDAAVCVSRQGVILHMNSAAEQMFGCRSAALAGQMVAAVLPDSDTVWQVENDGGWSESKSFCLRDEQEVQAVHCSGKKFAAALTVKQLPAADGLYLLTFVQDEMDRLQRKQRGEAALCEMQHRLLDSEENERQRLAQDLHDGPLQELHSLDFKLVAMARTNQDEQQQTQLTEMRSTLRQLARHLRAICQDLRPPALTPFGVSAVIRSFAEGFQREQLAISVALDLEDDDQRLNERTRLALYRICQQALRNVAHHANATHVFVGLALKENQVELRIEDDGQGFAVPSNWMAMVQQGKYGLLGCIERAEAIGGRVTIRSALGEGVHLRAVAPIHLPADQPADQPEINQ